MNIVVTTVNKKIAIILDMVFSPTLYTRVKGIRISQRLPVDLAPQAVF